MGTSTPNCGEEMRGTAGKIKREVGAVFLGDGRPTMEGGRGPNGSN